MQQNETICGIFKGGPRQLPHSPRPISTIARIKDHQKLPVNFLLTCQTKSLRVSLVTGYFLRTTSDRKTMARVSLVTMTRVPRVSLVIRVP